MKTIKIWKKSSDRRYYKYLKNQYIRQLKKYDDFDYFDKIIARKNINVELDSVIELNYNFGISLQNLKKTMGKPIFQFNHEFAEEYVIAIYEKSIVGIRLVFEFHFYKNNLFFFNKSFPKNYFWTNDEMEFLEMFCLKYGINDHEKISEILIVDTNDNSIFIEVDNQLTICNLAHNSKSFLEVLKTYADKKALVNSKISNCNKAS